MSIESLLKQVCQKAKDADAFADVKLEDKQIICIAKAEDPETQAFYKLNLADDGSLYVGIFTLDRWLSESIEADLVEHKDDIEELLADEMYELHIDEGLPVKHFRDEQLQYVFQTLIPLPAGESFDSPDFVEYVGKVLLAYESTFNQLGDLVCEETM